MDKQQLLSLIWEPRESSIEDVSAKGQELKMRLWASTSRGEFEMDIQS